MSQMLLFSVGDAHLISDVGNYSGKGGSAYFEYPHIEDLSECCGSVSCEGDYKEHNGEMCMSLTLSVKHT